MQSSKSSTLSDTQPISLQYMEWAAKEDYKSMLDELLAICHLDGGQYTLLAGYAVSLTDAVTKVTVTRKQLAAFNQRKKDGA